MPGTNRAATSPDYRLAENPRAGWLGLRSFRCQPVQGLLISPGIADRDTAVAPNASTAPDRRCLGQGATKGMFCLSCGAELPGKCWLRVPRDSTGHEQAHFPARPPHVFARPYHNSRICRSLARPSAALKTRLRMGSFQVIGRLDQAICRLAKEG